MKFILLDSNKKEAQATLSLLTAIAKDKGAEVTHLQDGNEALQLILQDPSVKLVITEYRLEGMGGLALIEELAIQCPHIPTILLSASTDASIAIKAVQAGAYDFLAKPVEKDELLMVIREALSGSELPPDLEKEPLKEGGRPMLIGKSRAMLKVYRDIAKLAATPVTVLIRGETGTGKELVASALHEYGHRAHKPFIAVNCAAIPDNLLESELFGHERGAFTGATNTKSGRFEQANGATLFLDEIGDMQPLLQAKMLRVLQERVIQRVGGKEEIPVDVRIIAATHRNLEHMVHEGTFRADLLYRLNGASLKLPPLRDRLGDTELLTHHFLHTFAKDLGVQNPRISSAGISFLCRQPWPGNVRQLQNVLRQALLKKRELVIDVSDMAPLITSASTPSSELPLTQLVTAALQQAENGECPDGAHRYLIQSLEAVLIPAALQNTNGNITKAAQILGLSRLTLREKIKALERTNRD